MLINVYNRSTQNVVLLGVVIPQQTTRSFLSDQVIQQSDVLNDIVSYMNVGLINVSVNGYALTPQQVLNFNESNYTQASYPFSEPVNQLTDLRNVVGSNVQHNTIILCYASNSLFRFDLTSFAADDGVTTIEPNDIPISLPGRWIKFTVPTSGSPGSLGLNFQQSGTNLAGNPYTTLDVESPLLVARIRAGLAQLTLPNGMTEITVPFSFNTASPLILQTVVSGNVIAKAAITITTPFDDVNATLQLGTTGTPGLLLDITDTMPSILGQYINEAVNQFSSNDTLRLVINPASSTHGAGFLLYNFRR